MPGMQSLRTLLLHEQQQRDRAQAALRQADTRARQAREQHAQLCSYRAEYLARWAAQFAAGGSMQIVLCYRSFTQRLDQAVAIQSRQVEQAQAQSDASRIALLEHERRVASVQKLIERRTAEHAQTHRRHEQKQTDDLAQRMRWAAVQRNGLLPHRNEHEA
jgi:flagellar protein FliJ